MAIPFKTLSFDPDNDVWGINFARWSWLNLVQFDNVSNRLGINSRLRFIPKAGAERCRAG
jgi:hypothetical protein